MSKIKEGITIKDIVDWVIVELHMIDTELDYGRTKEQVAANYARLYAFEDLLRFIMDEGR
jgi:hypothetical protein